VLDGILLLRDIYPNSTVPDFDRESPDIVSPLVKCAPALQVKAGMMPVAGENPIFYCPPVQRKAHMGTAIINCINRIALGK
jgi:hypothetical protein